MNKLTKLVIIMASCLFFTTSASADNDMDKRSCMKQAEKNLQNKLQQEFLEEHFISYGIDLLKCGITESYAIKEAVDYCRYYDRHCPQSKITNALKQEFQKQVNLQKKMELQNMADIGKQEREQLIEVQELNDAVTDTESLIKAYLQLSKQVEEQGKHINNLYNQQYENILIKPSFSREQLRKQKKMTIVGTVIGSLMLGAGAGSVSAGAVGRGDGLIPITVGSFLMVGGAVLEVIGIVNGASYRHTLDNAIIDNHSAE